MSNLLSRVDDILREFNITYILAYGTVLGSYVMHDILPWDDDLDIFTNIDDLPKIKLVFNVKQINNTNISNRSGQHKHIEQIRTTQTYRTDPDNTNISNRSGQHKHIEQIRTTQTYRTDPDNTNISNRSGQHKHIKQIRTTQTYRTDPDNTNISNRSGQHKHIELLESSDTNAFSTKLYSLNDPKAGNRWPYIDISFYKEDVRQVSTYKNAPNLNMKRVDFSPFT